MEAEVLTIPEKTKYSFDAIVVLGAFMQKDKKTGQWRLPTIIEEDPGKVVGGHSRAIAAKQADLENLSPLFLVTGGQQADETGRKTSRAQVLADLMTDKYKIPKEKVKVIGTIGNTMGNAEDTVNYLKAHPEVIKTKRLAILSNAWHLPRVKLIFVQNPYFAELGIELIPLTAEELLKRRSKHYRHWAKKLEATSEMAHRQQMEKQGIKALTSGKYKPLSS